MSRITTGLGTGTGGNGYNENGDQMAKSGWDQGLSHSPIQSLICGYGIGLLSSVGKCGNFQTDASTVAVSLVGICSNISPIKLQSSVL